MGSRTSSPESLEQNLKMEKKKLKGENTLLENKLENTLLTNRTSTTVSKPTGTIPKQKQTTTKGKQTTQESKKTTITITNPKNKQRIDELLAKMKPKENKPEK